MKKPLDVEIKIKAKEQLLSLKLREFRGNFIIVVTGLRISLRGKYKRDLQFQFQFNLINNHIYIPIYKTTKN